MLVEPRGKLSLKWRALSTVVPDFIRLVHEGVMILMSDSVLTSSTTLCGRFWEGAGEEGAGEEGGDETTDSVAIEARRERALVPLRPLDMLSETEGENIEVNTHLYTKKNQIQIVKNAGDIATTTTDRKGCAKPPIK